ncbi:MAG TPA: hypothetical protein VKM55_28370 [Candidatus Lokiarchaeia archaeon]|nr:hypothetical protein [Candidatus Lokiarchaeia archaeon]
MEDSDDRLRFVRAIGEVMKAIAINCQRDEEIDPGMYMESAKEAFSEFSSNMRDEILPTEEDVENGIIAEIDRERRFFQELSQFARNFKEGGLVFRIESTTSGYTPGMYRDSGWNTGIAPQCNIRVGPTKNYIVAFPTGPGIAVAKPDSLPATPIHVSPSSILLLPRDEDLDAQTWESVKLLFGEIESVDAPLPGILNAKRGTGFLAFESSESFFGKDLEQLFQDYDADVLFITSPDDNTTTLHMKTSKELSAGPMRLHYWAFPIFAMQEHGF